MSLNTGSRQNQNSRRAATLVVVLLAVAALVPSAQVCLAQDPGQRPVRTIGIVFDGPPREDVIWLGMRDLTFRTVKDEIAALTRRDYDVRFPEEKVVSGDWTNEGVRAAIDRLLADPEVDLILTLGAFATNNVARRGPFPKPVVGARALDVDAQRLPFVNNTTGVQNLNYLISPGSILRDVRRFREVVRFSKAHVLVDSRFLAAIPEVPETVTAGALELGLDLVAVAVDESADETLAKLPPDAEAVYITPLLRMTGTEFDRLIAGLIERRLPSCSLAGEVEVERGVMVSVRTRTEIPRLARRVALNVQRILAGEDAGTLPVTLDQPERLVINMATAQAIAVYPRWRVMIEAHLINDIRLEGGRSLTFSQAVLEAVDANLALKATERVVAAGYENIREAKSLWKPRIDASASGAQIDDDRAAASFGAQAESTGLAGVSVTQLIYSDGVSANVEISQRLQDSLIEGQDTERLDIALETAVSFLNVLRAGTLERVERDNLTLTESNLEVAQRRERIGASSIADVYRWEAELATDRSTVITAQQNVSGARAALNQLLHRPQEEVFTLVAPALADPDLVTGFGRLRPYIDNADSFHVFREFSVKEGLIRSPELRSIDAAIAAQERILLAARRSYWSPDVAIRGDAERRFWTDGAGSEQPLLLPPGLDTRDRSDWSVAVQATLPLFTGGARRAETRRATEELAALRLERALLAEQIELRVRASMFDAASTYTAIELSREAAEAARKNLELVTDAYSRGALSILDLLDAQNAALVAEEAAANAVFDFLVDLMKTQRATNNFDFFKSEEEQNARYERLDAFYVAAGKRVRP